MEYFTNGHVLLKVNGKTGIPEAGGDCNINFENYFNIDSKGFIDSKELNYKEVPLISLKEVKAGKKEVRTKYKELHGKYPNRVLVKIGGAFVNVDYLIMAIEATNGKSIYWLNGIKPLCIIGENASMVICPVARYDNNEDNFYMVGITVK